MSYASPRHIRELSIGLALATLSTAAAVHAQPRVIYTDAHAASGGNGASWSTAFRDLQDALAAADADPNRTAQGVEVRIAQGIYTPDRGTGNRAAAFVLHSAVTLMGGFAGTIGANPNERDPDRFVSVLSGDLAHNDGANFANYQDNSYTIADATNGDTNSFLDGLQVSGGNADYPALTDPYPAGVVATIRFANGVPVSRGNLSIRDCSIINNMGYQLPVITLVAGSMLRSKVEANRATDSWILLSFSITFTKCSVRGNVIVNQLPNRLSGVVETSNWNAPPWTANIFWGCLFADNVTGSGSVLTSFSPVLLMNCTIAGNTGTQDPAVLGLIGLPITMRNCIVARNTIGGLMGVQIRPTGISFLDANHTVLIDNGLTGIAFSDFLDPNSILSGDPLFVSPAGADGDPSTWQDNDYHLRPNSPALDRADATDAAFAYGYTDLDGVSPFDDPHTPNHGFGFLTYADLGCYEFTGALCPADFNASGSLTVADIFDFLTAWFGGDPRADINGGGVSVSDLFDYLRTWFAGC